MGRHSSESPWPFYRSLIGWFLPWVLIAGVVAVGVVVAVDAMSGDEITDPIVASSPSERPSPSPSPTEPEPTTTATKTAEPKPKKSPKPSPKERELITEGMTVQVLNGTGVASADDDMANRLAQVGFEVVALGGSNKEYAATTVFWSVPEAQDAAERLAERFGWVSGPKPANLSATVRLHVVVGMDEV